MDLTKKNSGFSTLCHSVEIGEIPSRTLFAKISWKQCFTKEITKELILTKLFLVRENFSQSVSRKNIPSSFFDARIDFTENSVKEVCLDFTKYFSIFWWIFSTLYGNYLLISSWQKTLGHAHAIHSYISWGEIFSPAHKLIKQINCFPTWYE